MARRRNQIPSTSETNLYFANIMLIAFCVQSPAIFLHSGGKFPSCSFTHNYKSLKKTGDVVQEIHFINDINKATHQGTV